MAAYYNEIDPYCCRVLEKQIKAGNLPPGDVDCRDIREVKGEELKGYGQKHLFAGIGGFALGFQRAGMSADFDILTGGFPCQPFSTAGRRQNVSDDRYLWPDMLRIIQGCGPQFVLAENVSGIAHEFDWVLEEVCDNLEGEGYETIPPLMVPACSFGAPHRRNRVWILANAGHDHRSATQQRKQEVRAQGADSGSQADVAYAAGQGCADVQGSNARAELARVGTLSNPGWWDIEPAVGRVADGVSKRVDRLRGLGNAIVPDMAELIGVRLLEVMEICNEPA